jgi:CDGSH-type Zn-finger protein
MKITCLPNGPYSVSEPSGAKVGLCRESGAALEAGPRVALCRCGGSSRKPFCDGTHAKLGFSDRNAADASLDRRVAYEGKEITIFDNRAICAHAGFCTDGLKSVFRMNAEPWIEPDAAAVDEVIATIRKCPSGALSYARNGVEASSPPRAPVVTVMNDGPYAVTGGIELVAVPFGEGASREHYTLCRCGGSKNKPFCDGTHWSIGFKDP